MRNQLSRIPGEERKFRRRRIFAVIPVCNLEREEAASQADGLGVAGVGVEVDSIPGVVVGMGRGVAVDIAMPVAVREGRGVPVDAEMFVAVGNGKGVSVDIDTTVMVGVGIGTRVDVNEREVGEMGIVVALT